MPSFSVAIASADALTAANRRLAAALGEEEEKLRRPVLVRSWTGVATIGLAISLNRLLLCLGLRAVVVNRVAQRSVAQVFSSSGPLVAYPRVGAFCSGVRFFFVGVGGTF